MRINKSSTAKGFTLIELLIVIAIIGILAVIVLAILNPQLQRDRARDGIIRSTMTKMNQAVQAFYAVHLQVPTRNQFQNEIENIINANNFGDNILNFAIEGVQTGISGNQFQYFVFEDNPGNHNHRNGCIRTILFETGDYIYIGRTGNFNVTDSNNFNTSCP